MSEVTCDVVLNGDFWRKARQRAELSAHEAARRVGWSRPWLLNIEAGRTRLPVKMTVDLATVLGLDDPVSLLVTACKQARRAEKGF
jgi:transcriptional regulator with XRE-family HTH domain